MRRAQKKRAEEFIRLLEQAHEEIKRAAVKRDNMAVRTLLADCQRAAIALGELIEETEGETCAVIPLLEEYCEQVYCFHEEFTQAAPVDAYKLHRVLRQTWIRIGNFVKNEIRERLEAVFLPYKASMWDSLESVWQAADADPDCDAYVIPIPYYDRRSDQSFGALHDESGLYPEYVPVTRYEEYDFEERRPDVIFIHNPYDKNNFITSVAPCFYAENLKRFTDCLVYIPYFILDEIDPEDRAAVNGMEHFCLTPGVLYADKVVVQSEAMRKIYINVLTKTYGEETRKGWERKILGLGSPKVDKLFHTRKEDQELPKEWLRVIQKPSAEWKKIILYNTSVGALLQYEEQMLEKMRRVFEIFKEKREETALLWRPHPLIEATIAAMRPRLWEEYQRLVEEYRKEGWGIYDDSAKLDRALAVSDGYYGDWSSLVELCKSRGMPVMIQNVRI